MEPEPTELKQIRTFQGDVADTIGKQKESLVSIQRSEKTRTEAGGSARAAVEESESGFKKAALLLAGSLVLLALGSAGGYAAYREFSKKTAPPVISVPSNRLIAAKTVEVATASSTRSSLISAIAESETGVPAGQTVHLNIALTPREFMQTLETKAPGQLLRAFDELFMLGILGPASAEATAGKGGNLFLIIKISSFENAFAGMLAWEPNMAEDIGVLFSTRAELRDLAPDAKFEDIINRNKNTRVLYAVSEEDERRTLLAYSFFDQETLVITESEEALRTILGRLSAELLSR